MAIQDVFDELRTFADRSAQIIGSSASIATLQMKKKSAEKNLYDAYMLMGKYAYEWLSDDVDRTREMQAQMKNIEIARAVLKDLNECIAQAREAADQSDEKMRAERAALQEKKKKAKAVAEETYRNELNRKNRQE